MQYTSQTVNMSFFAFNQCSSKNCVHKLATLNLFKQLSLNILKINFDKNQPDIIAISEHTITETEVA